MNRVKLILLGGTSHVGKSTIGRLVAEALEWNYLSTDQLARHPGRPWRVGDRDVPDDVVQHYTDLAVPELLNSVLSHYRKNVWPIVDAIAKSRLNNPFDFGLVIEGSAILPDLVNLEDIPNVRAVWLTAPQHMIAERIKRSSNYVSTPVARQRLIDAFIERSIAFDHHLKDSIETNHHDMLDVTATDIFETLKPLA